MLTNPTLDSSSVVVITGAATGIGRSMADAFTSRGARVVIADIDEKAADTAAGEIAATGGQAYAHQVNVTDPNSIEALADYVYAEFGRVDVLCNNAGVTMRPFRASWNASLRDFTWMLEVNYLGVVNGLLSFVPRMRDQPGHKHMVNTASFTALDTSPGHAAYAASKAAVIALSDALRIELQDQGDDFGVTVLYAGAIPSRLATSERLRPAEERSDQRHIEEYQSPRPAPFHYTPRPVEDVGPLVVQAVLAGSSACLTHRYPHEEIERRLAELRAAAPSDG
jgi:NAD(P)-dependent dehydrogenase (short-subunit alcohol dehydrogenase family)